VIRTGALRRERFRPRWTNDARPDPEDVERVDEKGGIPSRSIKVDLGETGRKHALQDVRTSRRGRAIRAGRIHAIGFATDQLTNRVAFS
jgi:hypothetical protein